MKGCVVPESPVGKTLWSALALLTIRPTEFARAANRLSTLGKCGRKGALNGYMESSSG
jgi:hypothetical protein